jgi:hypothetical protein
MPDTEAAAGTESETPAKRDSKPAVESRELVRGGEICAARARVLSDDCGGGAVWWERRCVCVRGVGAVLVLALSLSRLSLRLKCGLFTCRAPPTWPQAAPARLSVADSPGPRDRRSRRVGR